MLQVLGMREPLSCHPGTSASSSASAGRFYFSSQFQYPVFGENILHTSHSVDGLVFLPLVLVLVLLLLLFREVLRWHCFKLKLLCCRCSMHGSWLWSESVFLWILCADFEVIVERRPSI